MARLSADLGIDPLGVLNAPGDLFEELARAHATRWTHTDELLALLLETVDDLRRITILANTDPKKRPSKQPTPYRYPRPTSSTPAKRRPATPDEIRRFFNK